MLKKTRENRKRRTAPLGAMLQRAQMSLGMGHWPEARSEAAEILRHDPDHVGALEVLAKALWQGAEFSPLLEVLRRLIRLNPYEPGYFSLQGAVLQAIGRYGEAVEAYERSLSALPLEAAQPIRRTLSELQEWQASLVAQLLGEDAVFRADYARAPLKACRAKGFGFARGEGVADVVSAMDAQERASLAIRPS
jgi:tetratricopeptide (TPR) repeat protein